MSNREIAQQRLSNQHLIAEPFERPADVVRWFGAVQAQDYYGALWALGLRMRNGSAADVEQAMAEGAIVRTHPMRGTWHFVAAEDIRWLLALTAPRMIAGSAYYYRQLELDGATLAASNAVIVRTLQGGKQFTRRELAAALEQAGISTTELRLTFLIMRAELDGVIVSGARRGKQFTYALLDELVPAARILERDEALAELARRYFTSHGPATAQDFAWWSSLTIADARTGAELAGSALVQEIIDGQTCWFSPAQSPARVPSPTAYLLPPYDEYTVAYKDRSAILDPAYTEWARGRDGILSSVIAIDGQIVGNWKREFTKDAILITISPFTALSEAEERAIAVETERYGAFFGMPVKASVQVA